MISVICPFYNEEVILDASVRLMIKNLETLPDDWELIVVDDGSRDHSLEIARRLEREFTRLRVLTYPANRGRGYAIRTGVAQARGQIVVTTEIDSSWGDDIVHRIVAEFTKRPDTDIIIASPHLPGGGYKNVPWLRFFLSSFGNRVIRSGLTYQVTMITGMTRGYRREKFLALPLDEDEKEMHLEIVNKALAFGYRIYEIPTVLEWKQHRLSAGSGKKRRSSANIGKLIRTHLLFSVVAMPFRYLYAMAVLLFVAAVFLFSWAVVNLFNSMPSVYQLLTSLLLGLGAFIVFSVGVLAQQNRALQRDLWRVRSDSKAVHNAELRQPARSDTEITDE